MLNGKRVLAIIPARKGSKGIKNKNIRIINGKPLIYYSIKQAVESIYIDTVFLSTDSKKIQNIGVKYGAFCPCLRSRETSLDTSRTIDTVLEVIDSLKRLNLFYDILILLQPTSPLRTSDDIDNSLRFFMNNQMTSVVSISETYINPFLLRRIENDNKITPIMNGNSTIRRQELERFFSVNGSLYINQINELNPSTSFNDNKLGFIVKDCLDIDDYNDLKKARHILRNKGKRL